MSLTFATEMRCLVVDSRISLMTMHRERPARGLTAGALASPTLPVEVLDMRRRTAGTDMAGGVSTDKSICGKMEDARRDSRRLSSVALPFPTRSRPGDAGSGREGLASAAPLP